MLHIFVFLDLHHCPIAIYDPFVSATDKEEEKTDQESL